MCKLKDLEDEFKGLGMVPEILMPMVEVILLDTNGGRDLDANGGKRS